MTIAVRRTLRKSQLWIPFLQFSSISILYGVGWAFGLAMTGITGIGATVLGAFFIATGGLLGVYMFLIYGILSPTVRSVWRGWLCGAKQKGRGKLQKPSTPVKQLLEASVVSEKPIELRTPCITSEDSLETANSRSSIVIANIALIDSLPESSDKTDDERYDTPCSSEETQL